MPPELHRCEELAFCFEEYLRIFLPRVTIHELGRFMNLTDPSPLRFPWKEIEVYELQKAIYVWVCLLRCCVDKHEKSSPEK